MSKKLLAVKKKALKLIAALDKSCDALNEFSSACRDADLPFKGLDDSRVLLLEDMVEYASHLRAVHDKEGGAA